MTKPLTTKEKELQVVNAILGMGAESLDPGMYDDLERILKQLSETRCIPFKAKR